MLTSTVICLLFLPCLVQSELGKVSEKYCFCHVVFGYFSLVNFVSKLCSRLEISYGGFLYLSISCQQSVARGLLLRTPIIISMFVVHQKEYAKYPRVCYAIDPSLLAVIDNGKIHQLGIMQLQVNLLFMSLIPFQD